MDVMNQAKERDISELVIKDGDLEGGATETKLELSRILMEVINVSLKRAIQVKYEHQRQEQKDQKNQTQHW